MARHIKVLTLLLVLGASSQLAHGASPGTLPSNRSDAPRVQRPTDDPRWDKKNEGASGDEQPPKDFDRRSRSRRGDRHRSRRYRRRYREWSADKGVAGKP